MNKPDKKVRRLITIDKPIDEKLEKENASGLINKLLKRYFRRVKK
jgi:hypothetical protein